MVTQHSAKVYYVSSILTHGSIKQKYMKTLTLNYTFNKSPDLIFNEETKSEIVKQIKEKESKGLNFGEINAGTYSTPRDNISDILFSNVSHKYSNPVLFGDVLTLQIQTLDTPMGKILDQIIDNSITPDIGIRALGYNKDKIVSDVKFIAADIQS